MLGFSLGFRVLGAAFWVLEQADKWDVSLDIEAFLEWVGYVHI